jgi:small subunit ribosomal protein S17
MSEAVLDHPGRPARKERIGTVVSDKMDKTIVVRVERRYRHTKYSKEMTARQKYYAHDEGEEANIGDTVKIVEMRPLSRLKRWRLVEIVYTSKGVTMPVLPGDVEAKGVTPESVVEAKPAAKAKKKS